MARKTLNEAASGAYAGDGESNNEKSNDNFAELDQETVVLALAPNSTTTVRIAKPVARTLSGVAAKRHTALATGTITLTVQDGDGTTLLNAATIDATAFTASFVDKTLTATTADLALAAGEPITLILTSNNGSATGGPAIVKLTFAAA